MQKRTKHGLIGVILVIAIGFCVALTPVGASAARLITGKDIKDGNVKSIDIRDNGVKGKDIKDGTITGADIAPGTVVDGEVGVPRVRQVPRAQKVLRGRLVPLVRRVLRAQPALRVRKVPRDRQVLGVQTAQASATRVPRATARSTR